VKIISSMNERRGTGVYVRFIPNTDVRPPCIGEITKEDEKWYCLKQVTYHPKFDIGTEYLCVSKERCELLGEFGYNNFKEAKMKNVWEIIVINKENNAIIARDIIVDGDEKSACSKVSINFADKLKDLVFDNLVYVTKQLGSF